MFDFLATSFLWFLGMFVGAFLISHFGDAIDSWPPVLVLLFGVALGAIFGHLTSWLTISLALLGALVGYVITKAQHERHVERIRRIGEACAARRGNWAPPADDQDNLG
jgi:ABC-type Fe3+-siderophore transport system permease subunit